VERAQAATPPQQQSTGDGGRPPARYVRSSGLRRPPPPVRATTTYPAGCLLQRLATGRLADLPFLLPTPDKCTTEHALAVQVCRRSCLAVPLSSAASGRTRHHSDNLTCCADVKPAARLRMESPHSAVPCTLLA
jgi:hypothetical protein